MAEEDEENFKNATECWFCNHPFSTPHSTADTKVRDYCHRTGKYRGAAHNACNINAKQPKIVPMVIHNLSGPDGRLFF